MKLKNSDSFARVRALIKEYRSAKMSDWVKAYTVTALILQLVLYIVIFCFSAEDAENSSITSAAVTEVLIKGYYGIWGPNGKTLSEMVMLMEGFVRKAAHFSEYFCLGFLSCSVVSLWYQPVWKGRIFVAGQVFLSAGLDEFHQYFIPGRNAAIKDVMIDTAGGVAGILFLLIIKKLLKIRKVSR